MLGPSVWLCACTLGKSDVRHNDIGLIYPANLGISRRAGTGDTRPYGAEGDRATQAHRGGVAGILKQGREFDYVNANARRSDEAIVAQRVTGFHEGRLDSYSLIRCSSDSVMLMSSRPLRSR